MNENQDMSQYLGIFMDEGQEQLGLLEQEILRMERGDHSIEILQSLFRSAHTLKGSSRTMGFLKIGDLTHQMENVLDDLRNNKISVDTKIIDALLDCLDALTALIGSVAEHGDDTHSGREDIGALVERLDALRVGGEAAPEVAAIGESAPQAVVVLTEFEQAALADALASNLNVYEIIARIDPECMMKPVRAYMVLGALEPVGTIIRSQPSDADTIEESFDEPVYVLLASGQTPEAIHTLLAEIQEVAEVNVTVMPKSSAQQPEVEAESPVAEAAQPEPEPKVCSPETPREAKPADTSGQTIRVGLNRLDALLNLVGELVIDRTQIMRLAQLLQERHGNDPIVSQLSETMGRVSRVTSELQDQVMKTRMLPIDGVFQRMPRMVRDLAQKTKKEIELHISGGETELDRSVIEVLGDPLIHILRNSLDHGIEPPEERTALGKSSVGQVTMSARYEESRIVIDITDDGRGIDPSRIREAAVKKGIVSEQACAAMSDREAINLIMASGFSTAAVVSDISGRGVGMDIVKSNIEKIGGRVFIESRVGFGSTFTIHLPLTLAIVRALLVKADEQTYIIPLNSVSEMLSVAENDSEITRTTVSGQAVIIIRGDSVPLAGLADLLHGDPAATNPVKIGKRSPIVVVGHGDQRIGICVDSVLGEQEVVIKSLGTLLGDIPGISGASILGDGHVAMIVDVAKAVDEIAALSAAFTMQEAEHACA